MPTSKAAQHPVTEREHLLSAVRVWAEKHPDKNAAVIQIMGSNGSFSPLEIIQELEGDTPAGKMLMSVLLSGVKHSSVQDLVARFLRTAPAGKKTGEATGGALAAG
jgi:hypothetical protein